MVQPEMSERQEVVNVRSREDALSDVRLILQWKPLLPKQPSQQTHIGHFIPATDQTEKLPFGLDQVADQDGPRGFRTEAGCDRWLHGQATLMLSFLATYTHAAVTGSPGAFIGYWLDHTYPWTRWTHWPVFSDDLRSARRHIGHHTGHSPQAGGTCPNCAGVLLTERGKDGCTDTAYCPQCKQAWPRQHLNVTHIVRLRQVDDDQVWITLNKAQTIWPWLYREQLRRWVLKGTLPRRDGPGGYEYPLGTLNAHMNGNT